MSENSVALNIIVCYYELTRAREYSLYWADTWEDGRRCWGRGWRLGRGWGLLFKTSGMQKGFRFQVSTK